MLWFGILDVRHLLLITCRIEKPDNTSGMSSTLVSLSKGWLLFFHTHKWVGEGEHFISRKESVCVILPT